MTSMVISAIRYIHGLGIDEPLALIDGKNTYYYHAARVVQTYEYDPGIKRPERKNQQPYTFTARMG